MIPDCDGRSDGQTVRQTESIIANTALCIATAMLTRCKNGSKTSVQATQCTDNKQTTPTMPQTHWY